MGSNVLMIAFHFPPAAMGSGHLRTLGFARYLPEHGWDPIVLSTRALAYSLTAPMHNAMIPAGCLVHRALALDARRHFGVAGRYPGFLAQPDRWASWWPAAVWAGLRLIRRHKVRAIWSTYPIMTAHCIARTLSRMAGLPWIADFRDPVANSISTDNRYLVASQRCWEQRVMRDASHSVFTTPGALQDYAERYPQARAQGRLSVIQNGYDEAAFADIPQHEPRHGRAPGSPLILLHSGLLYPDGRNPASFFAALARLKAAGKVSTHDLKIVLRGSGFEARYASEIQRLGLDGLVTLAPVIPNREALAEQAGADGLLLFQGSRFDRQIPAKLYEYLRIGRPIFALAGLHGDTATVLRDSGGAQLAPIDDVDAIEARLLEFVHALRDGRAPQAGAESVARYSRREGAIQLAHLLSDLAA